MATSSSSDRPRLRVPGRPSRPTPTLAVACPHGRDVARHAHPTEEPLSTIDPHDLPELPPVLQGHLSPSSQLLKEAHQAAQHVSPPITAVATNPAGFGLAFEHALAMYHADVAATTWSSANPRASSATSCGVSPAGGSRPSRRLRIWLRLRKPVRPKLRNHPASNRRLNRSLLCVPHLREVLRKRGDCVHQPHRGDEAPVVGNPADEPNQPRHPSQLADPRRPVDRGRSNPVVRGPVKPLSRLGQRCLLGHRLRRGTWRRRSAPSRSAGESTPSSSPQLACGGRR